RHIQEQVMDTLHTVLRSIRHETKARRDHLDVFREFLDHLGRAARRRNGARTVKSERAKAKRGNC
ncbi:MAG TPA: hypothetical protein VFW94_04470, partial [Candidatus Acidoferrales bacterium]|nr:hypothetical protein [Candidatus Acidoferrales bacterium]